MSDEERAAPRPLLSSREIEQLAEHAFHHPLNPEAVRHQRSLGDAVGLERMGIHLVRVEPGHETTELHFHYHEEEFIYIVSGRGVAEIGPHEREVGPGDFLGFARCSLPHAMRNPFDEELLYLMGGLRLDTDVCEYPRLGKRLVVWAGRAQLVDVDR